jgi:LytS/YehU family sensor histidine kinase
MNPHFLFNSLNTLSSLIQENAEEAEDFLDHMSKVYRYLLRNRDEQLVTLKTEIDFITSYYYLLKKRHCEGLQLSVHLSEDLYQEMIPPLTLQMIVENSINQNSISRNTPLHISITSDGGSLLITNTIQRKLTNGEEGKDVLNNISNKYYILSQQHIEINEKSEERSIRLPLFLNQHVITS